MDNETTTTHIPSPPPPPHIFSAPPLSAAPIAILTSPPPPFPTPSGSVDLSPLGFLLAIVVVVAVPAIVCTFIFAFRCPSCLRRPARNSGEVHDGAAVTDLRYRKDADVKEIGSECPICLSAFADGEKLRQLSSCKHSFHADCINLWLSNHSNCPVCRSSVAGAGGKRPSSSAPARDHDLQQGLPDASGLV